MRFLSRAISEIAGTHLAQTPVRDVLSVLGSEHWAIAVQIMSLSPVYL